jgi:PTS system N-acetylglucosamine-specific IIC component
VELPQSWSAAFGGADNLCKVERLAGRLRVEVADRSKVDVGRLSSLNLRAVVWVSPDVAHVLHTEQLPVQPKILQ